jgi:hypothetical protein
MTIQNQIPKLIVSILLVTFSYAIAGLLIDLMWTSTFLVINIFHEAQPAISSTDAYNNIDNQPFGFVNAAAVPNGGNIVSLAGQGAGDAKDVIISMFSNSSPIVKQGTVLNGGTILGGAAVGAAGGAAIGAGIGAFAFGAGAIPGAVIGGLVGAIGGGLFGAANGGVNVNALVGNVLTFIIGYVISILVFLVLMVALLVALFRLWFTLLKAYVFVLIGVVLSPLWFLIGTLPGKNGFNMWLKFMLGNLAAFPAAVAMLLMGKLFMVSGAYGATFVPPLIGDPNGASFLPLVGIGFILATPGVVELTKSVMSGKGPQGIPGLGGSLKSGLAAPSRILSGGVSYFTNPHYSSKGGTDKKGGIVYPGSMFTRLFGAFKR